MRSSRLNISLKLAGRPCDPIFWKISSLTGSIRKAMLPAVASSSRDRTLGAGLRGNTRRGRWKPTASIWSLQKALPGFSGRICSTAVCWQWNCRPGRSITSLISAPANRLQLKPTSKHLALPLKLKDSRKKSRFSSPPLIVS